jgi:lambda family phage portal protein
MNILDKFFLAVAPGTALKRLRARTAASALARHYEAATPGRRTQNWPRRKGDANATLLPALSDLRAHSRDLVRNNPWARKGLRVVTNHTVGWGITAKPVGGKGATAAWGRTWKAWAGTTAIDADGQHTFAGLQKLVMRTVAESGEALVRRRWRRASDGWPLPLQLQVLEPDYLDTTRDGGLTDGGEVIGGIEFDKLGRRVAYWLYSHHPGGRSHWVKPTSKRVAAADVIHVFDSERAGGQRGVPWFAPVILRLKDFDEYEDATLLRQKIAACFAAFVTDPDGAMPPLGQATTGAGDEPLDEIGPGMIANLQPGKSIEFANPPSVSEHDGYSKVQLRAIAAGLGITYEALTGDYSQVNYSSARMARIEFQQNVHDWHWNMLIPKLCDPVWAWAMEAAQVAGVLSVRLGVEWTPPPIAMLDPLAEAKGAIAQIRGGLMTPSAAVRERGFDPDAHFGEYAEDLKRLDDLGIVLDADARRTTQTGNPVAAQQGSEDAGDGNNGDKDETT